MSDIERVKGAIGSIHELAERLGLTRPDPSGNYRSPHHPDKSPSLQVGGTKYPDGWYDHSAGEGGDAIDLVRYVLGLDFKGAMDWLREQYRIPTPTRTGLTAPRDKTLAEHIADRCRRNVQPAIAYLTSRGILPEVAQRAAQIGAVGFNEWTSATKPAGTVGHGGPGTAFIVKTLNSGHTVAVDLRYHDPALNGGVKTQSHGEKSGYPWFLDRSAVERAHTVVIVESAINALTVESVVAAGTQFRGWTALATRGTATVTQIDWRFLRGKKVLICMDHDEPDAKGICPGDKAAWALHEVLTGDHIACHLIDQDDWLVNDLNDLLQAQDLNAVGRALHKIAPWGIPGVPGRYKKGRVRVWLPSADYSIYFRFRCREDFTSWVDIKEDEEGMEQLTPRDVAGFRIAAVSQVTIASALSTMTGEKDHQPTTLFAVTAQTPYHGQELIREVATYPQLNNMEWWKRIGPIWRPAEFLRLISLWGRATAIGKRDAVNFVGLCYKNGQPTVNEGPDCYFAHPERQCLYHNFRFPTGPIRDAATVIRAYEATFSHHGATLLLTWALGAHIKAFLSFWPHLVLQARKASGKTTLLERLSRTTGVQMLSGQSVQTEFRIVASSGFTSQPIIWEEISARKQEVIDRAISILQESYKFLATTRGFGGGMVQHLNCAPVLMAGEDVPIRSLLGKVVRVQLRTKGPLLPHDLPHFPLRPWLDWLAKLDPSQVLTMHGQATATLQKHCRAPVSDAGAERMIRNYAALWVAWELLLDFAGLREEEFGFVPHLTAEMNAHIAETGAEREPWVWILDLVLNELAAGAYPYPFRFEEIGGEDVLLIRTSHVMHHIATKPGLRAIYDGLPVKSDRVFKRQLRDVGVIRSDREDPVINGARVGHMIALSLPKLAEYGLYPTDPAPEETRYS